MKEEDLTKAIELKKKLDSEREILKIVNSYYVDLRVNLEERFGRSSDIRDITNLFDDDVIKGLRAMVIAKIEKRVNDLQEELEKL